MKKVVGKCELTGTVGRYIDSHLLPKALTRAGRTRGEKYIEDGPDSPRVAEVSSSWYDKGLVTGDGEDILSRLDNWGIRELRRAGLVWSSPSPIREEKLLGEVSVRLNSYTVHIAHPKRLRVFILSLLWRAAATRLSAFSRIALSKEDLDFLRRIIIGEEEDNKENFPILLWYLIPPGIEHNHTPIFQQPHDKGAELPVGYFRIYVDGLLIMLGERNSGSAEFWRNSLEYRVFDNHPVRVITQPFRQSRQYRDITDVAMGVHRRAG